MQHLDEGTIHAWLDGELTADEAAKAEAHASECLECAALVAEARGLIAASTRILTALDDIPSGVIPTGSDDGKVQPETVVPSRRRYWYDRTDLRAAAALLFVAGASLVAVRLGQNSDTSFKAAATANRLSSTGLPAEDAASSAQSEVAQQETVAPERAVEGASAKVERNRRANEVAAASAPAPAKIAAKVPASTQIGSLRAALPIAEGGISALAAPGAAAAPMAAAQAPPPSLEKFTDSASGVRRATMMDLARSESAVNRIEGRVTDSQRGEGIAGANVMVQGTTLNTATDKDGRFRIENVPAGEQRLIVRRIGYSAQTVPVSVSDRVATANPVLTANAVSLSEAIVTGVAASATIAAPAIKQVSEDTTGGTRRVVYEVSPGIRVTLVESRVNNAIGRDLALNQSAKRAAAATDAREKTAPSPQAINTISWSGSGHLYMLSGPLSTTELEAIKTHLMQMRR